jgi:thiol-disulfide isomerase/thioredoxin
MKKMLFLALIFASIACNRKPAPTEADVKDFVQTMKEIKDKYQPSLKLEGMKEEYESVVNDSIDAKLALWDIMQASLEQIKEISQSGLLYQNQHLRALVHPRLLELAEDKGLEGANAMAEALVNFPLHPEKENDVNQDNRAKLYKKFAHHPGMPDYLMQEGNGGLTIFTRLQFLDPDAIRRTGLMHDLIPILDMEMSPYLASSSGQYLDEGQNPKVGLSADSIQILREKALKKTLEAKKYYEQNQDIKNAKSRLDYINNMVAYLSGNFARAELIGYAAPEVAFHWISSGSAKSLADLKGKVVVLDFWATWCGPCVGSFPNVRKLQERYANYEVEIIGVTAIQGYHFDRKKGERIQLPNNPEEEMDRMHGFMKDFEMTWKVAFSDKEFNPDFGVRGIPHVAIIDANGIVRYNQLRPYEPPYHEAEKIDLLLKEAGLPYPMEKMEEGNWAQ